MTEIKVVFLVVFVGAAVSGAPHHDHSGDSHTSPPNSDTISNRNLTATNETQSFASTLVTSDDILGSSSFRPEEFGSTEEGTTPSIQTTTLQTTAKPKTVLNEHLGSAHAPVAPIHHASRSKQELHLTRKSVVVYAPVAPETPPEPSVRHRLTLGSVKTSVVAHGPMAKNFDDHERPHRRHHKGDSNHHSSGHHGPMATELHSHRSSIVHHPSMSKHDVPTGPHPPIVSHENSKNDKSKSPESEKQGTTESEHNTTILYSIDPNFESEVNSTQSTLESLSTQRPEDPLSSVSHAPLAILLSNIREAEKDTTGNPVESQNKTIGHHPFAISR